MAPSTEAERALLGECAEDGLLDVLPRLYDGDAVLFALPALDFEDFSAVVKQLTRVNKTLFDRDKDISVLPLTPPRRAPYALQPRALADWRRRHGGIKERAIAIDVNCGNRAFAVAGCIASMFLDPMVFQYVPELTADHVLHGRRAEP